MSSLHSIHLPSIEFKHPLATFSIQSIPSNEGTPLLQLVILKSSQVSAFGCKVEQGRQPNGYPKFNNSPQSSHSK